MTGISTQGKKRSTDLLATAAVLTGMFAFVTVGVFTGYISGASRSPTISALLPLAVGLVGLIQVAREKGEPTGHVLQSIFWSIGAVLFCVSCYFGLQNGISARTSTYLDPPSFLEKAGIRTGSALNPSEIADITSLLISMSGNGLPERDAIAIFKSAIQPVFNHEEDGEYKRDRSDILRRVCSQLQNTINKSTSFEGIFAPVKLDVSKGSDIDLIFP